jgi:hypothetical protein
MYGSKYRYEPVIAMKSIKTEGNLSHFSQKATTVGSPMSLMIKAIGISSAVGIAIQRWICRNHLLRNLFMHISSFVLQILIDRSRRDERAGRLDPINDTAHSRHTSGKFIIQRMLRPLPNE